MRFMIFGSHAVYESLAPVRAFTAIGLCGGWGGDGRCLGGAGCLGWVTRRGHGARVEGRRSKVKGRRPKVATGRSPKDEGRRTQGEWRWGGGRGGEGGDPERAPAIRFMLFCFAFRSVCLLSLSFLLFCSWPIRLCPAPEGRTRGEGQRAAPKGAPFTFHFSSPVCLFGFAAQGRRPCSPYAFPLLLVACSFGLSAPRRGGGGGEGQGRRRKIQLLRATFSCELFVVLCKNRCPRLCS